MKNLTVEIAIQFLKENGYFVDDLWCVGDVKNICICTDEQAQDVLRNSVANEYFIGEINYAIKETAEAMGLEMIEVNED